MSGEEIPKKAAGAELIPHDDDIVGQLQEFETGEYRRLFNGVRLRISELGISCKTEKMFSMYLDGSWLRLLCLPHGVRLSPQNEDSPVAPGQRLIVNIDSVDSVRDQRVVQVQDYMVCYERGTMFELNSTVDLKHKDDEHIWDLHAGSGPLILRQDGVTTVHQGNIYRYEAFMDTLLQPNNIPAARNLLQALNVFSASCEDILDKVSYHNYNDL